MKKIVSLFVALLLLLSLGAFVTAQETADNETEEDLEVNETEEDLEEENETEDDMDEEELEENEEDNGIANEVAVMTSKIGAQVRLMQLEKSIARNIATGEKVVEKVLENNPEANVSEMNNLLAELGVIQDEVEGMTINESLNASEMAQQFVTIKEEARNMSSQFRSMAHERVSEQEREQIREEAENATSEELEETEKQLKERIREHNARQVSYVLSNMGVENKTLENKVRTGEMNVGEAVSQVAKQFRGLGQEKRQQARAKINEVRAQTNVDAQATVERARENMGEKMKQRAQKRKQKVEQKLEQVRKRIKSKLPDHVKDKVPGKMGPSGKAPGKEGAKGNQPEEKGKQPENTSGNQSGDMQENMTEEENESMPAEVGNAGGVV